MAILKYNEGVVPGRFQVLHLDHLKYLMAGKALCRHLIVGITSPDPTLSRMEDVDPDRNSLLSNPLTYYERYLLVNAALISEGLMPEDFSVVPFPINFPELYQYYVPMDAVFFLTIYDEWGKKKLDYFKKKALKTHVLREVSPEEKGISAGNVRKLMAEGTPWEHLAPKVVVKLLKEWGVPERIRALKSK